MTNEINIQIINILCNLEGLYASPGLIVTIIGKHVPCCFYQVLNSINLIAFFYECLSLIGYATRYSVIDNE